TLPLVQVRAQHRIPRRHRFRDTHKTCHSTTVAAAGPKTYFILSRVLTESVQITQRAALAAARAAEARRQVSEARFQAVFAEAAVGITMVDPHGCVIAVNAAMADMLGHAAGDLVGQEIAKVIGSAACTGMNGDKCGDVGGEICPDAGDVAGRLRDLLDGAVDRFRVESARSRPDGRMLHLDLSMSMVRDSLGYPDFIIGVAVDLTERRRLENRLWHEARHDELTGLPNRKLFFERMAAAGEIAGLCYLDLDGFKNINDGLGHDTGDRVLVTVAQRLRQTVEAEGCTIARLGSDEFVVLVTGPASSGKVTRQAERMLAALAPPIRLGNDDYTVTGSIGVVHAAVTGNAPSQLMRAADISLQHAKAKGRARWERYDPAHGAEEVTRHSLATAMPLSLSRGEFFLEYQPLVELPGSAVSGFEALVRWRHPRLGMLAPDRFIPVAEETGHIIALGRWVLEESCRQARRWFDEFPAVPITVSVNVAATQLREPSFVADVLAALDDAGLPPDRLQLELTESAVAGDTSGALAALGELANAGVILAIDDFGTGYSNLAHLGRLPVHTLKIDRSFLAPTRPGGPADPAHDKIVAATISLAHSLGLNVAAEGVESTAQADQLRLLHCDSAQGFLFGAPASAADATTMISRQVGRASSA
ncbi:MAG: EAL domain-containing protein, partial [Actinophytocola sp.]|nr:EAL domain-containing protein [Actinophytocola sp.]